MNKILISLSLMATLVIALCSYSSKPQETPANNYKTYCSSCHGEQVEMFVDRKWKHGTSKNEIIASITNGYSEAGMPTWKEILEPKEIDEMANYITDAIAKGSKYTDNRPKSNTFTTFDGLTLKLDTVVTGLDSPWGMAFLPDGNLLVSDRNGNLYKVTQNGEKTKITGVPEVVAEGQGGLLDVALHPNFAQNQYVYISYSKGKTENATLLKTTAIIKSKLVGNALTEQKEIFVASPWSKNTWHYGSRIVFDQNGYIYFSVGDRGTEKQFPQSLDADGGKIHRIKDDGSIPADNPYVNSAHPSVYSYGHRNPQGLVFNALSNEIWEHEHGPRGGDEINIIKPSNNYGWPVISYGINYDGKPITNLTAKEGMQQPLHFWIPSIGPSGMDFVAGNRYPALKGNLLVGSLRFQYLNRCIINNGKVEKEEIMFPNIGRVRNVKMSPDNYIYVSVESPGIIFRLSNVTK